MLVPSMVSKRLFIKNINEKFMRIPRNDQQIQKHTLHFISTLHFQDGGQIQNGLQDWQTFMIIQNTGGNEVCKQFN